MFAYPTLIFSPLAYLRLSVDFLTFFNFCLSFCFSTSRAFASTLEILFGV